MNKILCNRLEFCFLHEVDVTYPGTCKLKNGYKFHYLPTDEVELTNKDWGRLCASYSNSYCSSYSCFNYFRK